jgi:hypothetical protein
MAEHDTRFVKECVRRLHSQAEAIVLKRAFLCACLGACLGLFMAFWGEPGGALLGTGLGAVLGGASGFSSGSEKAFWLKLEAGAVLRGMKRGRSGLRGSSLPA